MVFALRKIVGKRRELRDKKEMLSKLIKSLKTDMFIQKRKELRETKKKVKHEIKTLDRLGREADIFLRALGC